MPHSMMTTKAEAFQFWIPANMKEPEELQEKFEGTSQSQGAGFSAEVGSWGYGFVDKAYPKV